MPRSHAHAPLFDRERDNRANLARSEEIHAQRLTGHWLVLSELECQCLLDGFVPEQVKNRLAILLAPDPWVLAEK